MTTTEKKQLLNECVELLKRKYNLFTFDIKNGYTLKDAAPAYWNNDYDVNSFVGTIILNVDYRGKLEKIELGVFSEKIFDTELHNFNIYFSYGVHDNLYYSPFSKCWK